MFSEAFVCTEGEGLLGRYPLEPETLSLEAEPPPLEELVCGRKKVMSACSRGRVPS